MKKIMSLIAFVAMDSAANATVSFAENRLTAPVGTNYAWNFNGHAIDGCNGQSVVALADGESQLQTKKVSRKKGQPLQLFLIGDSTMADYTLEETYIEKRYPLAGWGQVFQTFMVADSLLKLGNLFAADSVVVYDKAKGGRSTRTFFQEGRWREVYGQLRAGDVVMAQFGHNDAAVEKTERYVPIEGYKEFLRLFVSQTIEKGALPILITPVARNYPWKDGHLQNVHGDYPDAMKAVAAEMNVPLIDLNELSMAFFSKYGQEVAAEKFFMNFGPGIYAAYPDGQKDNTHFNGEGATAVAQLVFNAMQAIKLEQKKGRRK